MDRDKALAVIAESLRIASEAMAFVPGPDAALIDAGLKTALAGLDALSGPTPEKIAAAKAAMDDAYAHLNALP